MKFWFTELVQNAIDAGWGNSDQLYISLDIHNDKIEFYHNGRPPHYRKRELGHDGDISEFSTMIFQGSTKRANLSVEGQFGIGFKLRTYHFDYVELCAEGWKCGWENEPKSLDISGSDVDSGMKLIFSKPKHSSTSLLNDYCENYKLLLGQMERLFSAYLWPIESLSLNSK